MSADRGDPEMRIPRDLNDNDQYLGYRTADLLAALVPAGVMLFLSQSILPSSMAGYQPFMIIGGLLIGVTMLFLTPNHLTVREWTESIVHHLRRPDRVRHLSMDYDNVREQKDHNMEARAWEVNQRTQELTRVKRVHVDAGAIERYDDTMVGAIKVEPANMALASSDRWRRMVEQWKSFINHNLEFPIQIYCTTSVFPVDDYLNQYRSRRSDADIENKPIMESLLEDFLEWYPEYLTWQGTNRREYYIIVTAEEEELRQSDIGEKTVLEKLSEVPGIGKYIDRLRASRDDRTEGEIEAALLKAVEQRCRTVAKQGIGDLKGCEATRVTGVELAVLIKEFWESEEVEIGADGENFRTQPAVTYDDSKTFGTEYLSTDGGYGELRSKESQRAEIERIRGEREREERRKRSGGESDETGTDGEESDGGSGSGGGEPEEGPSDESPPEKRRRVEKEVSTGGDD